MKQVMLIFMLVISVAVDGQVITLQECWIKAAASYPRLKDVEQYEQISLLRTNNIKSAYYPKLDVNGQATYQSDVTHIPTGALPVPGISIPSPAKDQYKLTVDLSQLIWDGGATKAQRNLQNASLATDKLQVDVDMYALKGRVAQLFYGIIIKQQQVDQLQSLKTNLEEKLKTTLSGVKYGAVLKANADLLTAEILDLDQQIAAAISDRQGSIDALAILTGAPISQNSTFDWSSAAPVEVARPEYALFNNQREQFQLQNETLTATRMPKIAAFGQAGYGRPGMNMFSTSFDPFYIVGIKASWNIFDWNSTKNNRKILTFQEKLIDSRQELFDQSQKMQVVQESANIIKYEKMIETDQQLVSTRAEVAKAYSVMYDNGAINAADYISRQTELKQAELNREMHRVMLSFSKVNLNIINGK